VIWDAHPLLEAIAAAVPGPPIAAFDAVKSACIQGTHAFPSLPACFGQRDVFHSALAVILDAWALA